MERIDPDATGDSVDDVLVIFFAKRPNVGGQYIIGWFNHAKVFRSEKTLPKVFGGAAGSRRYFLKARTEDCKLLRPDDRTFAVVNQGRAEAKNRPGTANVFYTHEGNHSARNADTGYGWIEKAIAYVKEINAENKSSESNLVEERATQAAANAAAISGQGFGGTYEERNAIDKRAMKVAMSLLKKRFMHVVDVSKSESYDLHCIGSDNNVTRVEVKGTRATTCEKVFLTRGEVQSARKHRTVLVVVTGIVLQKNDGELNGVGGAASFTDPWVPSDDDLRAITYEYNIGN